MALAAAALAAVTAATLGKASWRANVAWSLHSWIWPADRESVWEQEIGARLDPWDTLVHGRAAERPTEPQQDSHGVAASLGR